MDNAEPSAAEERSGDARDQGANVWVVPQKQPDGRGIVVDARNALRGGILRPNGLAEVPRNNGCECRGGCMDERRMLSESAHCDSNRGARRQKRDKLQEIETEGQIGRAHV